MYEVAIDRGEETRGVVEVEVEAGRRYMVSMRMKVMSDEHSQHWVVQHLSDEVSRSDNEVALAATAAEDNEKRFKDCGLLSHEANHSEQFMAVRCQELQSSGRRSNDKRIVI